MNKHFYLKLAASNLRKNSRTYLPYILASVFCIAMFYIICMLIKSKFFDHDSLVQMLTLGSVIIGIFSVIFLFYTNSFLIKRRQMEFGLFNVLGMDKRHIAKVISIETVYTFIISFTLGIGVGVLFAKLIYLVLGNMVHFELKDSIIVSPEAIVMSLILFAAIYTLTLLNSLRLVHLSKPIELLKGGQRGEREPKVKWVLTLIGLASLGAGYYMAITITDPLEAMLYFFVAVILVIIGTYCLFASISILALKILKKNKGYYYKTNHFISVSGMMYRMKQNAVGLANICILSTIVLVTISTTVSLYAGVDDILNQNYPRDISINASYGYGGFDEKTDSKVNDDLHTILNNTLKEKEYKAKNLNELREFTLVISKVNDKYKYEGQFSNMAKGDQLTLDVTPLEDFNKLVDKNVHLNEDEVLIYSNRKAYDGDEFTLGDKTYKVKASGGAKSGSKEAEVLDSYNSMAALDTYHMIVKDMSVVENIRFEFEKELSGTFDEDELSEMTYMTKTINFDIDATGEQQVYFTEVLENALAEKTNYGTYTESRAVNEEDFYSSYGGLLFLGLYLGILFLMATVLIIYYKQLSEGYEDKERFTIMQNVGLTKKEVVRAIRSQVLTMFFMPLIVACIHISFAFPMISKLLLLFNLSNTQLFIICMSTCAGVFAIFYVLIYALTSRLYYKIVESM